MTNIKFLAKNKAIAIIALVSFKEIQTTNQKK